MTTTNTGATDRRLGTSLHPSCSGSGVSVPPSEYGPASDRIASHRMTLEGRMGGNGPRREVWVLRTKITRRLCFLSCLVLPSCSFFLLSSSNFIPRSPPLCFRGDTSCYLLRVGGILCTLPPLSPPPSPSVPVSSIGKGRGEEARRTDRVPSSGRGGDEAGSG
ncbi:hypothetical protein GGS23DRAFT_281704 [Durotheca rogersii]|uniref:uncharacterized protein n=1 Tax=Durotheca rogersii TaxID=419775 RepID=UPI00221FB73D|nr:uncharacterized protein GGS23DRAFT_281704 [Durotheca rogersii]KAI5866662.1 hypothetical protein GGS23DRAFT_281704 [Durotheca rogersii]